MINEEQIKDFNENGVLVLRNFYNYEEDIKPIQHDIYKIIDIIVSKYNLDVKREPFNGENFFNGYLDVIKYNRSYGGEIYDAVKQLPSFIRLVSNKKNEDLYKQIRNSKSIGIGINNFGIRIDNPKDTIYKTDWHQEYLTHLRSIDGIVFWSPLHSVTRDMGAVEVLLKSNQKGLLKLKNTNDQTLNGNYSAYTNGLKIENIEELIKTHNSVIPETNSTDLIAMDFLTIHRSGLNITDFPRWSMQIRYFNFENEEGKKIKYSGSYTSGINPKNLYPEYFL